MYLALCREGRDVLIRGESHVPSNEVLVCELDIGALAHDHDAPLLAGSHRSLPAVPQRLERLQQALF